MPAIEVIDSRFKDFKFDIQSVIADNTSAARYVVGGVATTARGLDLRLLGVVMERNGELVGTASGAAVMGHPAASVVALVRWLAGSGQALPRRQRGDDRWCHRSGRGARRGSRDRPGAASGNCGSSLRVAITPESPTCVRRSDGASPDRRGRRFALRPIRTPTFPRCDHVGRDMRTYGDA